MTAMSPRRRSAMREYVGAVSTIMVKELRSRMRGRRAFVVLTVYLATLAAIAYGVYALVAPIVTDAVNPGAGFAWANASAFIGQSIFGVLSVLQLVLVAVIAPAFTAGQISLEREKQTLDLLVTTPMRPGAIIVGKLLTALAFVVLMIVAAIPISALVLMYGGADITDILRQQVVLLTTALAFGALGILVSAMTKRTQTATVVTYCAVLVAMLGSSMVFSFWNELARRDDPLGIDRGGAPEQVRYINPMVAMLDVVAHVEPTGGSGFTRPLYELFGSDLAIDDEFVVVPEPAVDPARGPIPAGRDMPIGDDRITDDGLGHWWPRVTVTLTVLALLLTLLSMRFVVPTGMRWAFARRRVAPNDRVTPGGPAVEEAEA